MHQYYLHVINWYDNVASFGFDTKINTNLLTHGNISPLTPGNQYVT